MSKTNERDNDLDFLFGNNDDMISEIDSYGNFNIEKYKIKKIMKNRNVKKLIEDILENKDILIFDDDQLYSEIGKNITDKEQVDMIYDIICKRLRLINEKALLFRSNFIKKYGNIHNSRKIIDKANEYIRRLGLTPIEKKIFINTFKDNLRTPITGIHSKDLEQKFNSYAKLFNYKSDRGSLNFDSNDTPIIKEIISLTENNLSMYNTNLTYSLKLFNLLKNIDINQYYNNIPINPAVKINDFVPPIIFALFARPIPTLEKYFNIFNIGMVIKKSYEHRKLNDIDNYIIQTLANDTDEYIDKAGNTLTVAQDLLYRVKIQISLWKIILFLRTKHLFEANCSTFYNLLSMYSPNLLNIKNDETISDSVDIMSKIFNVVNFKPIEISVKNVIYNDPNFQNQQQNTTPFIFKQGKNGLLYMIKSDYGQFVQDFDTAYRSQIPKTENIPFIYVDVAGGNVPMHIGFNSNGYFTDYDKQNLIFYDLQGFSISNISTFGYNKDKKLLGKVISKIYKINSIDNILIFIILRTQNILDKNNLYFNNQPLMYNFGTYKNKFNTRRITFGQYANIGATNDIYETFLDYVDKANTVKTFMLTSVLLNSIYRNNGETYKGNPYAMVINNHVNSGIINHKGCIVYQPYVMNEFSGTHNYKEPTTSFQDTPTNNRKLLDDIAMYGEVYIFTCISDNYILGAAPTHQQQVFGQGPMSQGMMQQQGQWVQPIPQGPAMGPTQPQFAPQFTPPPQGPQGQWVQPSQGQQGQQGQQMFQPISGMGKANIFTI